MELVTLTLSILACVLISALLERLIPVLQAPLIQIALGVTLFFLFPGAQNIKIEPSFFMLVFVSPLLYYEAKLVDRIALVKYKGAILALAIGLVFIITFTVGFTLNAIVPFITVAAACSLGAALGPTDAVAVTALPDNINISDRLKGILKGECLLNDASGIVAFEFALIAAQTGKFSATDASWSFLSIFIGGALFGIVAGIVYNVVNKFIFSFDLGNCNFSVLFDVFMPFLIYYLGESIHVSGVIAVVVAGIVIALSKKKTSIQVSKTNIINSSVWEVLSFTINGCVFVLLGCMIPSPIVHSLEDVTISNFNLVLFATCVTVVLIAARFLFCYAIENRHNNSRNNKLDTLQLVKNALILTFGGAKGAVTMAIVLAIPVQGDVTGTVRQILVFVAGVVILITLILSNFVIPILVPKTSLDDKQNKAVEATSAKAMIKILREVSQELAARQTPQTRHATELVLQDYAQRIDAIKSSLSYDKTRYELLQTYALQLEQDFVNTLLSEKKVDIHLGYKYLKTITRRQALLTHNSKFTWLISQTFNRIKTYLQNLPIRTKNLASSNNLSPGETNVISTSKLRLGNNKINNTNELRVAVNSHVLNLLGDQIAQLSQCPEKQKLTSQNAYGVNVLNKTSIAYANCSFASEELSLLMTQYRNYLESLNQKMPSLSAVQALEYKVDAVYDLGSFLEVQCLEHMLQTGQITHTEYSILKDEINLIAISRQEF